MVIKVLALPWGSKNKPSENSLLKLGRFGTDYSYGSLPYRIPLMVEAVRNVHYRLFLKEH